MRLLETALRARRILGKPPGYIIRRALQQADVELDRWRAPRRVGSLDRKRLLAMGGASSLVEPWGRLRDRPFPAVMTAVVAGALARVEPGESERILVAARLGCERMVD